MNISRSDAAQALASVETADHRMGTLRRYSEVSPFLLLWGGVWVVANAASDVWPQASSLIWLWSTAVGTLATAALVIQQVLRHKRLGVYTREEGRRIGRGFALMAITIPAYFTAMALVVGPLDGRQSNVFISLFWAFAYMGAGAWVGIRLFVTGAVAVVAIVSGYLYIHAHFGLWMAVFAGGTLMLAGFWLRRP